jgi:hypothetical protein
MNFLRPCSMLARCAFELRIATDFITIGFVYIFNQRANRYPVVL